MKPHYRESQIICTPHGHFEASHTYLWEAAHLPDKRKVIQLGVGNKVHCGRRF